jgi:NNP family nitrate/nitrite transporter-like MFS transporter
VAAVCVIAGSLLRPLGGHLADRFGGSQVLLQLFVAVAVLLFAVSMLPSLAIMIGLLFLTLATLGMGNGAVFQLVPNRFPREVGVITGIVGAAGGLGGFMLPTLLGSTRQMTGSYAGGFILFAVGAVAASITITIRRRTWVVSAVPEAASA